MRSEIIIWILIVLLCVQTFYMGKMWKKIKQYRIKIINYTTTLNKVYDAHHLMHEFGFIFRPFFRHVRGEARDIYTVRDEIKAAYDDEKQKTIEEFLTKTPLLKIQQQQSTIKRS